MNLLLPYPQRLDRLAGEFILPGRSFVRLLAQCPAELLPAGRAVQAAIARVTTLEWSLVAGRTGPDTGVAMTIALDPAVARPSGYLLAIKPDGITLTAHDPAGAFYGAQTLAQLIAQFPTALPAMRIEDWPDFPARGVMLDISRDKVPSMQTLYDLVDLLASWKINQLQLYTEHTFAYRAHPEVWAQASPMTGDEILALDAYCRERFVELVPNQNSFGHMERWLILPRYRPLSEAPDGFDWPNGGHHDGPFTICPLDPGSIELLGGMYDELLPHFESPLFNVGCDETFDLGLGRSKAECEARGRERVYLEFLLKVCERVRSHGRTMQFWGDIILHKPELIGELPKDIIALEWGYEANHPFDRDGELFAKAGVPFYVCPGTSSWCSIAGRTDNALGNLRSAAENGLKRGAIGYLNTDWGDYGHWQYLPVSYLGFAAGAAHSWATNANRDLPVADVLSLHAFGDSANVMGKLAFDLGNVYQACGKLVGNSSTLFRILASSVENVRLMEGLTREGLIASEAAIDAAMRPLDGARMRRADAALIADEFRNSAAMLRHACRRGRWRLDGRPDSGRAPLAAELRAVLGEHRRLWLARNRPGGLAESTKRLEDRLAEYK